jgi:hypothetical protein
MCQKICCDSVLVFVGGKEVSERGLRGHHAAAAEGGGGGPARQEGGGGGRQAPVQAEGPLHGGAGAGQVCGPAHDGGPQLRLIRVQLAQPGRG